MSDVMPDTKSLASEGIKPIETDCQRVESSGVRLSWVERRVFRALEAIRHGRLQIDYNGKAYQFGEDVDDGLYVKATITRPNFFKAVAFGGSLGAAEAYINGDWSCVDLTDFLRLFCRNLDQSKGLDSGFSKLGLGLARAIHKFAANTRSGSRRNISKHYDLGNDFFALFLDPSMMYSSALFDEENKTLEEASTNKVERICQQLKLQPTDRILEIGTGWGGFALHAAQNYGCHITTTTISQEQHHYAQSRIKTVGLTDRVELLLKDYRDLSGFFDHIVSIEMIEAVGHEFLPTYFQKCDQLLKPGGSLTVQAITMPDQRYERYRRSTDFIQRYIFPGGHLPSIGAMQDAISKGTHLVLTHAAQFPDSYAQTLREWRRRFLEQIDNVRALGFDERFIRTWEYYFCYCEAAFLERAVSVGQFQWERSRY